MAQSGSSSPALKDLRGGGLPALLQRHMPGLWLVGIITAAAYGLRGIPAFPSLSPMILGIVLGVVLANLAPIPAQAQPGIQLSGKGLLRAAVALLGLQVTLGQIAALGISGLAGAAVVLAATFFLTCALGRLLGVSGPLTTLIAAGTSVCGAAAISACNGPVRARDEEVTYAVAAITLFGTIAMFCYPLIGQALGLEPGAYGTWIGLSVHEVAQVVAAGFQGGDEAGRAAVIVKLSRVILLAALVFGLAARANRGGRGGDAEPLARVPLVPAFVLVFLGLSGLHSLGLVPEILRQPLVMATPVLLTAALSALGLGTHFGRLRRLGLRPMLLSALSAGFIAVLSLMIATA